METIVNDVMEFDVYKSSKGYVKSNTSRHTSRKRNSWKVSELNEQVVSNVNRYPSTNRGRSWKVSQLNDPFFKEFNNRLKSAKVMSNSYIIHKEVLKEGESLPIRKIEIELKENTFFINNELKEIAEEIKFSEELLDFDGNSEYETTLQISKELYFIAIRFLIEYSEFIFKNLGVIIQAPEINAGRNGNVYLSWRTDKARLAISVEKNKTSEIIANYYGDLGNDKEPIKGNVTVSKISEYLAYWMKYLS